MSVVVVKIELAGAVSRVQPFAFGVSFADRRGGGSFRQAEKAMVPQSALRADLSENPLILLAERQTSKLMTRVRFPSPAPAFARRRFDWQAGREGRPPKPCISSSRPESNQCTAMTSFQASYPANQETRRFNRHRFCISQWSPAPSTAVNQMNDGG
jgi:hypothetical protein